MKLIKNKTILRMNKTKTYQKIKTKNLYTMIDFKCTMDGITYMFKLKSLKTNKTIEVSDEVFNNNFVKFNEINNNLN